MSWKKYAADYLVFTRKERIGVLAIFILIILVLFLPELIPSTVNNSSVRDTSWVTAMEKLERTAPKSETENDEDAPYASHYQRKTNYEPVQPGGELFFFDPNTISFEDWSRLGLREKTIRTIQHYLQKGGRFRKPADLQRIYGMHSELFARLEPYIRIEETGINNDNSKARNDYKLPEKKSKGYVIVDINTADTSAFINLPGIGSKLAGRIVNFRDKLGGFYAIEQISETFGLPDSIFQKIKPYLKLGNKSIKKININTVTVEELKMHPYIRYGIANPIIAYRNEHGLFQSIEDIKKVMAVTDDIYKKIQPYLVIINE